MVLFEPFKVPGFDIIEEIYRTSQSVLFRALREKDSTKVVLKTVPARFASQETTAHLRREFVVAKDLQDSPFIAKPLELVEQNDLTALVLEDFGATSLQAYVRGGRLVLHDVLRVGIAIASALDHVHAGGLLHLDVKPANILVSNNLAVIKLTDFSISSLLPEQNQGPVSPESLRGTAAYISPEQTGRMNRTIDSRTDLYALGVTLYELLTGSRPFYAEELQHLLYQHLAVVPVEPCRRAPAIPEVVSAIVMKCLLKDAASRYQTAAGLKADLEMCLDQLVKSGTIVSFPLGRTDQRGQLRAPEHVLGRAHEIQMLFHCHKRVVERESMEVILISGYSGIGKTSLVGELQRAHATGKEAFVQGKFDQYSHDTPFKPLIAAMQCLLRQVLCEPAATINVWKEKVQAALGRNGRLMTDVLPSLAHLIGQQPEPPPVEATAAQNRFADTFVRFIRTCAQLRSPLVLFLDDMQWSDGPSLRLLEALVKDGASLPMLLIGAYRDVEVDKSHALMRLVTCLQKGEVPLLHLYLGPLKLQDTIDLVGTCLGLDGQNESRREKLTELSQLVQEKTEGNPFYSLQFLRSLVKDGLLQFDQETGECRWGDMARLHDRAHVTMNVVDFMANELRTRLPQATLSVLSLAACIGDVFSLRELTLVCEEAASDLVSQLWPALTSGFIFLVGKEWQDHMGDDAAKLSTVRFQFRHDRIRQAAYQEVDKAQRPQFHLQVGRHLMAGLTAAQYEESQYSILHHFNEAIHLIRDADERMKLAKANVAAGAKAKGSTAYEVALSHARSAKTLLGAQDAWKDYPDLALEIDLEEAECLSLIGNHEEALAGLDDLKERVQGAAHALRIAEMRVNALILAGQLVNSMSAALEALAMLGHPFPSTEAEMEEAIAAEQPVIESRLPATDVAALPEASDPKALARLRLMDRLIVGGYSTGQVKLIHLLSLRMVSVVLDSGHSPAGCIALLIYATFFDTRLKRYQQGYTLGRTALDVLERLPDQSKRGQALLTFASAVGHWVRPIQECILSFEDGLVSSLDHGDHVYGAYHISQILLYTLFAGAPLEDVKEKAESSQRALHRIGDASQQAVTTMVYHATRVLVKDVTSWSSSDAGGEVVWDEGAYLQEHADNALALAFYYLVKMATHCFLGDYREAEAALKAMGPLRQMLQPTMFSVQCWYYEAILCSQLLQGEEAPSQEETTDLEGRLKACVEALEEHAEINPASHQHRYCLARAELERWKGNDVEAEHFYGLAIDAAEDGKFIQDAALAYLFASRHYSSTYRARLSAWHLSEAQDAFAAWGATAVLHRLSSPPPCLRPGRRKISDGSALTSTNSFEQRLQGTTLDTLKLGSFSEQSLDIQAVLAASQTLSSAIVREALLEKLLGIVLETAGARYVVLVLKRPGDEGGWYVEGSASVQIRPSPPGFEPPSLRNGVTSSEEGSVSSVDTVTRVAPAGQVLPLNEAGAVVPQAMITYVTRTQEVVLGGAELGGAYKDPYLEKKEPRSVLCMPIVRHGDSCGVLYVEHELLPDAFRASRIKILAMLSSQIAISIENSALYEQMQSRQNELIAAKNAAEEATRAKSLFLATMSHEIRTPLNAIIGMTSMLMGLDLSPEKQECVETIRQSGDQLLAVISDVLDFSKIEAGTLELEAAPFSIRQCLEEAADLVAARASDKGLQLATHTHNAIPAIVVGDVSRLRQVLVNLLSNAVKFTNEGEVILEAKAVNTRGLNLEIAFTCRDTGVGIAAEHIPRLFVAFSQADASTTRKFGGTGLGLAISDRLVKAMGGRFKVDSELGKGSVFRFSIQVTATDDPGPEPDIAGLQDLKGKRCLLIVHNKSILTILSQQLAAWGIHCTQTAMVEQAGPLLLEKGGRNFDFLVADKCEKFDQAVPDLNKCPVAQIAPQLPVIILCSWTDWETRVLQSMGPLRCVISKPVKLGHLWDALMKLVPGIPPSPNNHGFSSNVTPPSSTLKQPVVANPELRSSLRILLTEDNPVNQRVAQMLLKRLGYRADCVADGMECIRSLETRPYDLVLMDLSMPVMDGLQAARVICSRWPKGKRPYLVAVTANAMEGDRDRCLAAGMDAYISKPVRINELQKVLDAQAIKNCRLESPHSVLENGALH